MERFLKEQRDGSVGADVGCGNGKYLGVNRGVYIIGSDRYVFYFSSFSSLFFSRSLIFIYKILL